MDVNDTTVILERIFTVDGVETSCRIFGPAYDGQDFSCRYEIGWNEGVRSRESWGVDAFQALLLAMQAVHTDLLVARKEDGREVLWLGQQNLGLPIPETIRDLAPDNSF